MIISKVEMPKFGGMKRKNFDLGYGIVFIDFNSKMDEFVYK